MIDATFSGPYEIYSSFCKKLIYSLIAIYTRLFRYPKQSSETLLLVANRSSAVMHSGTSSDFISVDFRAFNSI